jgi:hypothetical protein
MLLWLSILLFIDAGCSLWFESQIARALPRINVRWIALGEAMLGLAFALWHFGVF